MKKLISILLIGFLGLIAIPASAEIKFEIVYTDKPGEGFHIRPEARKAVEEAVGEVFSWLDHDADVRIEVKSFVDPSKDALAMAHSASFKKGITPGIYHTNLARKILFNESMGGWDYDAVIMVNFYAEDKYAYGDELGGEQLDFKSIIIHELTHALGFTSWIENEDEDDIDASDCLEEVYLYYQHFEAEITNYECKKTVEELLRMGLSIDWMLMNFDNDINMFTYFDTLLVDYEGNKVLDSESLKFLRNDLFKLEDGDSGKCLYFPFEEEGVRYAYHLNGMDASHLTPGAGAVMESALLPGLAFRQWSGIERKIIQALGYKLKLVQEPVIRG